MSNLIWIQIKWISSNLPRKSTVILTCWPKCRMFRFYSISLVEKKCLELNIEQNTTFYGTRKLWKVSYICGCACLYLFQCVDPHSYTIFDTFRGFPRTFLFWHFCGVKGSQPQKLVKCSVRKQTVWASRCEVSRPTYFSISQCLQGCSMLTPKTINMTC